MRAVAPPRSSGRTWTVGSGSSSDSLARSASANGWKHGDSDTFSLTSASAGARTGLRNSRGPRAQAARGGLDPTSGTRRRPDGDWAGSGLRVGGGTGRKRTELMSMPSARLMRRPPDCDMPRQFLKLSVTKALVGMAEMVLSQLLILTVCSPMSITSPSAPYWGISTQSPTRSTSLPAIWRLATKPRIESLETSSRMAVMAPSPVNRPQGDLPIRVAMAKIARPSQSRILETWAYDERGLSRVALFRRPSSTPASHRALSARPPAKIIQTLARRRTSRPRSARSGEANSAALASRASVSRHRRRTRPAGGRSGPSRPPLARATRSRHPPLRLARSCAHCAPCSAQVHRPACAAWPESVLASTREPGLSPRSRPAARPSDRGPGSGARADRWSSAARC